MNWRIGIVAAGIGVAVSVAGADVKLPAVFGDHMVLQREQGVPVWGWADAGEKVTVTAGGETATATADGAGNWKVVLGKMAPSAKPMEMTVSGKNTITLHDVLVGDVWVCSGQSNMEFGVGNDGRAKETIAGAENPEIRLFQVTKNISLSPQRDVSGSKNPLEGHWVVCTPENIVKVGGWNGFSAVGYYFGKEIQAFTKVPVGLVGTYWGGTAVESWTSRSGLEETSAGREMLKRVDALIQNKAEAQSKYQASLAEWERKDVVWKKAEGAKREEELKTWWKHVEEARAKGEQGPPWPPSTEPQKPMNPMEDPNLPTMLNNGMVSPLQPYGIKGVIWYQGEQNSWQPVAYRSLFPGMIRDWRARWGEGDFPFLFVQLAGYQERRKNRRRATGRPCGRRSGWR